MNHIKDQLISWMEKNKMTIDSNEKQPKLSEREIKDLMGMERASYGRGHGGALRQK